MLIHKANGQMTNIKVKTKKIPSEMEEAPPQKLLTPLRRLNTATTLLSLLKHCVYSSPSLLNEYLWYDKLWGPSQRVVTLFILFVNQVYSERDSVILNIILFLIS